MVPRGGPSYPSNFNELEKVGGSLFPVGFLGFLANPPTASGRVPTLKCDPDYRPAGVCGETERFGIEIRNEQQKRERPTKNCFTRDALRWLGVPVGNLRSEILVVQSAQNWHRQRATHSLDGTRDRRVLVQR
jgi:hypothetical protein